MEVPTDFGINMIGSLIECVQRCHFGLFGRNLGMIMKPLT